MTRCTCEWDVPDTRCPKHGLYDDVHYPPMNRHAREIVEELPDPIFGGTYVRRRRETAAEVQVRLYGESRGGSA